MLSSRHIPDGALILGASSGQPFSSGQKDYEFLVHRCKSANTMGEDLGANRDDWIYLEFQELRTHRMAAL
jgi:hypothetical protein